MRSTLLAVILASAVTPSAFCQCAIKPIKPIPPIGCRDLTPQCVSDNSGHGYWTWICVPSGNDQTGSTVWEHATPTPLPKPTQPPPVVSPSVPAMNSPRSGVPPDTTPSPDISWVRVGMPQQTVLSGLAGQFKLTKEGLDDVSGSKLEVWSVEDLRPSQEFWEIAFIDGKVGSIITHSAPLLQGEALTLAQRLFADLYPRGNADAENDQVAKFLGKRWLTVKVEMWQMTSEKGNQETMRFHFQNGRQFEIEITVPVSGSPDVSTSEFQTDFAPPSSPSPTAPAQP